MPCVGSAPAARGLGGAAAGSLARILAGVRAGGSNPDRGHGRVKPGSGKGQVKAGSGTRAGQIRNGKGRHQKKKRKKEKRRKTCGCNHTGRMATTAVITGLTTTRGYNRSWNRGPRGCGCNQSLNLDRVSGVVEASAVAALPKVESLEVAPDERKERYEEPRH